MELIINLLDKHGQGGNCNESRYSFTYHNSFLIADRSEAWILETAGPHWAAEQIKCMCRRFKTVCSLLHVLPGFSKYSNKKLGKRKDQKSIVTVQQILGDIMLHNFQLFAVYACM